MTVRQKATAKTVVMRGIVDELQGPARTILIAQMQVERKGWASNLQLMYKIR